MKTLELLTYVVINLASVFRYLVEEFSKNGKFEITKK